MATRLEKLSEITQQAAAENIPNSSVADKPACNISNTRKKFRSQNAPALRAQLAGTRGYRPLRRRRIRTSRWHSHHHAARRRAVRPRARLHIWGALWSATPEQTQALQANHKRCTGVQAPRNVWMRVRRDPEAPPA